jgi:hypothetical protein
MGRIVVCSEDVNQVRVSPIDRAIAAADGTVLTISDLTIAREAKNGLTIMDKD